jgi:hypothetical protein
MDADERGLGFGKAKGRETGNKFAFGFKADE